MREVALAPAVERNGAVGEIERLEPAGLPGERVLDLLAELARRRDRVRRSLLQRLRHRCGLAPIGARPGERDVARAGEADDRGAVAYRQAALAARRQLVARDRQLLELGAAHAELRRRLGERGLDPLPRLVIADPFLEARGAPPP